MPRTGPRRPYVGVRLDEHDLARIDELAVESGHVKGDGEPNRSEMIREILKWAMARNRKWKSS